MITNCSSSQQGLLRSGVFDRQCLKYVYIIQLPLFRLSTMHYLNHWHVRFDSFTLAMPSIAQSVAPPCPCYCLTQPVSITICGSFR
ncbi:unnamed protein product [Chondrus crispus]|uniref:Uncharacterized protein n=1 Tax=Chondrus crispus TaxID=2769 RepID=R7QKA3_CHOCR|nr:unnamed protein product [Chondrus crispus]CDF38198.1 unnamed protein product [Chondrus crispus]|eukprot:XP_005718067.1 unnamed protein product [Chondrus crispus]